MTKATSVTEIKAKQDALQKAYNQAQGAFQNAQGKLYKVKATLIDFNKKYGRVIAMMEEDKDDGPST